MHNLLFRDLNPEELKYQTKSLLITTWWRTLVGSFPLVRRARSGAPRGRPSSTARKTRPGYRDRGNNRWNSQSSVPLMTEVLVTSKILFSVKFQVNDNLLIFFKEIYERKWFTITNVYIISQNNYHSLLKLKILKNIFLF